MYQSLIAPWLVLLLVLAPEDWWTAMFDLGRRRRPPR